MQSLPTLPLSELAALLHRSPITVRRRWRAWAQQDGFPPPLPGMGLLWSRQAVMTWLDRPGAVLPDNDNSGSGVISQWTAYLESRPRP